ncbi:hypothetical protein [Mucilaginibacter sp.]
MKRITITVLLLLFTVVVHSQSEEKLTKKDEKVLDMIASLPEVVQADKYIIKVTKHHKHLETYIDSKPSKHNNKYSLTVAEDNGMNLVPHFKFVVDAKTYAISYWDVANDKNIPLSVWRAHHHRTK